MTGPVTALEWGEMLPPHWRVRKLKHLCDVLPSNVDKKSYDGDEAVLLCNYTDVYYNERITERLTFMQATATSEQIDRFSLRAGDTIITKDSETADDIAIPAYVPEDFPGVVCGYHLAMVRPREGTDGAFVSWWFRSRSLKASAQVRANGLTRVGLSQYALDNLSLPFPPLPEQTAIAAFLDRETGKIDALVEQQKRLIELLKEKRQAVISRAVTKGLDPTAPMKPSGAEWLGDVPEHWELVPVKRLSSLITSGPRGWSDQLSDQGQVFFQSQNIGRAMDVLLGDCRRIMPSDDTESQRAALSVDDVVVCITGARTGAVAHVRELPEPAYINQHVCLVRPKDMVGRFMAYSLTSIVGQQQLKLAMYGLKQGLSLEDVRETTVLLPAEGEQAEITSWLDAQTSKIDALMNEAEVAAALLAERRSSLISAAVTGKIDVRAPHHAEEMVA